MTCQHYRGYDIDVSCTFDEERYSYRVRIIDPHAGKETHACASAPQEFGRATEAEDKGFQYARAWVELHPLRWPFARADAPSDSP